MVFLISLFTSCEDFVEVDSFDPNADNFFQSEQEYVDALTGAYDLLQSTYLNVLVGEIASDNTIAGGENPTNEIGIQLIDQMSHVPENVQLRQIWSWMYGGVNRASYVLEFENEGAEFEDKANILAQARFLRAYYYFELVKWFGGVPLKTDGRIQFGQENSIDRASKEEVYAAIENDLLIAIDNLPETQPEAGRVTKGAARALLGKAYLYQNKFDLAAEVLDEVIISGRYKLLQDEAYQAMFENVPDTLENGMLVGGENTAESVFEIQYTDAEGASFQCLQCSEGNVAVGFSGIRGYRAENLNDTIRNSPENLVFDTGFSFNLPTQEVVDAFEDGDFREDVSILDIEEWIEERKAIYTIAYEGTDRFGNPSGHTGYYNRKYLPRKGDLNNGDQNLTNPNNYRAIRFADVLLMAAEAHAKRSAPDNATAVDYLNRVRNRAKLPNTTASGGQGLIDAIYQDRRVELVGEGHRFFDLVRTGRAAQEILGFEPGKHEVFPIPQVELDLVENRWEQNPGY